MSNDIDILAYNEYIIDVNKNTNKVRLSFNMFVKYKYRLKKYYKIVNIKLRNDKINKIKNVIN